MTGKMTMGRGWRPRSPWSGKRPNKMRIEFTIQGMTGVQAYDGKTGWSVMPFLGKNDPEADVGRGLQAGREPGGPRRRR